MQNLAGRWFLDGVDLYTGYGIILQDNKSSLLTFAPLKEPLTNNWPDENGSEVDLSEPRFNDFPVTLKLAFLATSENDFNTKREAFRLALMAPGSRTLRITDHDTDYICYYNSSSNFNIGSKRISNVDFVYVTFDLGLTIQNEYAVNVGSGEPVYIKTSFGQMVAVQPPGSTYIVPSVIEISGGNSSGDSQYNGSIGFIGGKA